jgi:tetratricopeptide (TPR) repeat protein
MGVDSWEASQARLKELEAESTALIESHPNHPRAHVLRASIRIDLDDLKGAMKDLDEAIRLSPEFGFAYVMRGRVAMRRHAVQFPSDRVQIFFTDRGARVRRIPNDLSASPWLKQARQDLQSAMKYKAEASDLVLAQSLLDYTERRYAAARSAFTEILKGQEFYPELYYLRGCCAAAMRDVKAAVEDFSQALKMGLKWGMILRDRALACTELGDWKAAIDDCKRAQEIEPSDEALLNQASYEMASGFLDDAERDLAKLPVDREVQINRAHLLARRGRSEEALKILDEVLRKTPKDVIALGAKGDILQKLGRNQDALRSYDASLKLLADQPQLYNSRASARRKLGDLDGALADSSEALRLDPGDPINHFNRGVYHNMRREYKEAIEDADHAIERDGALAEAYALRGEARFRQINPEGSGVAKQLRLCIEDFERALKLRPELEAAIGQFHQFAKEQLDSMEH